MENNEDQNNLIEIAELEHQSDQDISDPEIDYTKDELYDSDEDNLDEKFIQQRVTTKLNDGKAKVSDAILLCPLCMIPVCYDCQRHVKYPSQYRAMLVENVEVNLAERLTFRANDEINGTNAQSKPYTLPSSLEGIQDPAELLTPDTYFPAHCQNCRAQVGVYDNEMVYHFFGVIVTAP